MNYRKTTLLVLLAVSCLFSTAQINNEPDYNKPKAFADLPEKMKMQVTDMEALLNLPVGTAVNTAAAAGLPLIGTVVSTSDPQDLSVKSVVIKLTNRQGAIFTFTRISTEEGEYQFRGRIISKEHIDALEIIKENGNYLIVKKGLYDLVNE